MQDEDHQLEQIQNNEDLINFLEQKLEQHEKNLV
eukprot:CAMPEP_0176403240 /NCGR_PEP_ID=MMETSP0126-20121128/49936_1 /TAXON_ID=141414 ORGANISM="Strombidinopsis acuminatum, Strain SPMC142" /NCGR_SAMPLE_ID=MMETSP0126 /ASSEMBLY_ACC=CAM_ASM_000229 /LENGTH=33 /DNA_ID= /DNA_START= /DNA_END= /DNA_ORIENTATION=